MSAAPDFKSRRVCVEDCTLREGELSSDVYLTDDDKVKLAVLLYEAGVQSLECDAVGLSASETGLGQRLRAEGISANLTAIVPMWAPDWKDKFNRTVAASPNLINLSWPSSDIRLERTLNMSRSDAVSATRRTLAYAVPRAREQGISLRFWPADTFRADPDFAVDLVSAAVEEGVDSVAVLDTSGSAVPSGVTNLVERFVAAVGTSISIQCHFHNDRGLALANTLAAFEAGASILQCTINGVGERNGITALAELVVVLETVYGVSTGVRLDRLQSLSHAFSELTGVATPPERALVGDYAFAYKLDLHAGGAMLDSEAYEPVQAERVGGRRHFVLGKYTGPNIIRHTAARLGIDVPEQLFSEVQRRIELAATANKRSLSESDFVEIVNAAVSERSSQPH
jgi:2-isopropylmalate synthase